MASAQSKNMSTVRSIILSLSVELFSEIILHSWGIFYLFMIF